MAEEDMADLSDDVKALYTEQEDETFILTGIEGIVPKTKLDEFRTNNIELKNTLDTFKDIDPVKHAEMVTEIDELKIRLNNSDFDDDAIKKIVEKRVQTMQDEMLVKEQNMKNTIGTQARQIETMVIDGQVKSAALEHGIAENAMDDVTLRAKSVFRMEEGKAVGYNGENKIYDDTGVELQNINGWVKGLEKTAAHLFKASQSSNINNGDNTALGDVSKMSPVSKIRSALS